MTQREPLGPSPSKEYIYVLLRVGNEIGKINKCFPHPNRAMRYIIQQLVNRLLICYEYVDIIHVRRRNRNYLINRRM